MKRTKIIIIAVLAIAMFFLSSCFSSEKQKIEKFDGSWEAFLNPGIGTITLNCDSNANPPEVTLNLVSDIMNLYYLKTNREVTEDKMRLWWNGEEHRAEMEFHFNENGQLEGTYTQYGETSKAVFTKVSELAGHGETEVRLKENYADLLLSNNDFQRPDAEPIVFTYDYDDSGLDELDEKYGLTEIAGQGDTESRAISLLKWVGDHTDHVSDYDNHVTMNAIDLLEYSYDKGGEQGLNCFNLSIILTEACLSQGIQARNLWLMPGNPDDMDNHVVTMAYIPEREKWIMLDPSSTSYFSDKNGVLSASEIRDKIMAKEVGDELVLNPESTNGYKMDYINYLAKDMFYFYSYKETRFGMFEDPDLERIYLCPEDLNLADWYTNNMYFKNSNGFNTMTVEELEKEAERYQNEEYIFTDKASFWGR